MVYTNTCCDMIAMKREVATQDVGFPWSECQVRETGDKSLYKNNRTVINRDGSAYRKDIQKIHTGKCTVTACRTNIKCEKEATFFMASQVMRITLKAYDHQLIDASAKSIIETVKKTGAKVSGPVPMPTKKEVVTILRAVHKYKDSREQFEQRTHKRLIDIITPTQKTVDALSGLEMPAGVDISIKMK